MSDPSKPGHDFLCQHHDEFAADVTAFLDADRETV